MKISLICTTYNEQENIQALLASIQTQTRLPDEIIIVDSNSSDRTQQIITNFQKLSPLTIRLISKKTNRSQARNLAISKAKHQVIAVTDSGCVLNKRWLDRITKPILTNQAESVAGYYIPITPSHLQLAIAPFVSVLPAGFDPQTFLPSSRSVAFTKKAWKKAGKYPAHLDYCEDLVFADNLKNRTLLRVESKALVYWIQKDTFTSFFHQISNYARGDIQAGYTPHLKKITSVYLRYLLFIFFPHLFLLYLFFPVLKHVSYTRDVLSTIFLVPLQITADFAVMYGAFEGIIIKFKSTFSNKSHHASLVSN